MREGGSYRVNPKPNAMIPIYVQRVGARIQFDLYIFEQLLIHRWFIYKEHTSTHAQGN